MGRKTRQFVWGLEGGGPVGRSSGLGPGPSGSLHWWDIPRDPGSACSFCQIPVPLTGSPSLLKIPASLGSPPVTKGRFSELVRAPVSPCGFLGPLTAPSPPLFSPCPLLYTVSPPSPRGGRQVWTQEERPQSSTSLKYHSQPPNKSLVRYHS